MRNVSTKNTVTTQLADMILHGDALDEMRKMPEASVDCVITDPPYGYSFMGKSWDKAVPSVDIWRECLRVLKSGAFAFVMSAPRQDVLSQMLVRLGEAGFNTGFTSIYWTYASGFPKAMNVSKAVDKRLVGGREKVKGGVGTDEGYMRGFEVGKTYSDQPATAAAAAALDGSYGGFQPKPAVEIIIVVMKPLSEKTYVDQALANGKGVTWLDDARIPTEAPLTRMNDSVNSFGVHNKGLMGRDGGRFPANLLVSDDVLNDGVERTSGAISGNYKGGGNGVIYGKYGQCFHHGEANSGSYSRFFSLDAWFAERMKSLPESVRKTFPFLIVPKAAKGEKNHALEGEEKQTVGGGGTAGRIATAYGAVKAKQINFHPTCKPLQLMSYLITLGSRPGDTVLDPFVGSGTTVCAAKMLRRNGIGIEREAEYVKIAEARLAATPQPML